MTSTVKCNNCNIVIDELLAYVQNKISIIDEDSLVRICVSAFSSDQIVKSYNLLSDSLPLNKRKLARKGQGKENRILNDIINLFRVTELDIMPVFVARNLEMLPPITFDHLDVTKLLKDLTLMQEDIKHIKTSYVTLQHLEQVKNGVFLQSTKHSSPPFSACKVNMKRGAYINSGPSALSDFISETDMNEGDNSSSLSSPACEGIIHFDDMKHLNNSYAEVVSQNGSAPSLLPSSPPPTSQPPSPPPPPHPPSPPPSTTQSAKTRTERKQTSGPDIITKNGDGQQVAGEERDWILVQKRKSKQKNRYSGKIGTAMTSMGNFRAAEKKIPIFITNVHRETNESDIVSYIKVKTGETIMLEKLSIKRASEHNAYKFFVTEGKSPMFLSNDLWPQGIIFRRFMHFKARSLNRTESSTVDGLK